MGKLEKLMFSPAPRYTNTVRSPSNEVRITEYAVPCSESLSMSDVSTPSLCNRVSIDLALLRC